MAREIVFTDDITGEHGAEPVQFGWDGVTWELDLTDANKAKLQEALQPYMDKAHPANVAQAAATRTRAPRGAGGAKRTIPVEEYGFPRRGRKSAEEADYVRNNLDEVNARLRAAGEREIDPTDQKMKDRYGL
jgi:Lsr2